VRKDRNDSRGASESLNAKRFDIQDFRALFCNQSRGKILNQHKLEACVTDVTQASSLRTSDIPDI